MKQLILYMFLLNAIKGLAQCTTPISFSIQTSPESCVGCCDGTAQITNLNSSPGCVTSIVWQPNLSTAVLNTNLCAGNYSATVYSACCPAVMMTCFITTNITTEINDMESASEFNVFPNPNNGAFTISAISINEAVSCKMHNVFGQETPLNYIIQNNRLYITTPDALQGVYWLEIYTHNHVIRKKIIKN